MKINNLTAVVAVAAGAVGAALALPSTSAVAGKPDPGLPAVAGCYDIRTGAATFHRSVRDVTQKEVASELGVPTGLYEKAQVVLGSNGVVQTTLGLADISCTDVTYVVSAFHPVTRALLGTIETRGDGVRAVLPIDLAVTDFEPALDANGADMILLQAHTKDSLGRTVDTGSPSGPKAVAAPAEGDQPPPPGGGQQFWG